MIHLLCYWSSMSCTKILDNYVPVFVLVFKYKIFVNDNFCFMTNGIEAVTSAPRYLQKCNELLMFISTVLVQEDYNVLVELHYCPTVSLGDQAGEWLKAK